MILCRSEWKKDDKHVMSIFTRKCYSSPDIGMIVRVFANGPGDLGSILGRVIPKKKKKKKKKMVLDASLLNTQHYKVWIKGAIQGKE